MRKKIFIRFFESKAANFTLENSIFNILSNKGMTTKFIESDLKSYRIEEFFEGRPFKYFELH